MIKPSQSKKILDHFFIIWLMEPFLKPFILAHYSYDKAADPPILQTLFLNHYFYQYFLKADMYLRMKYAFFIKKINYEDQYE